MEKKMFYGKHIIDGSFGFFEGSDQCLDAQEISLDYYRDLLKKQEEGFEIHSKDGYPVAEKHIQTEEEISKCVRSKRNDYLEKSDVEMLPDNFEKKSEREKKLWCDYRQYLRDIPQNAEFPDIEVKNFTDWQILLSFN